MNLKISNTITEQKHKNDIQLWVEKYRPNNFENIVLDKWNKIILNNIINSNDFPNLLFYGPPGTGKTTTIINMIKKYQEINNHKGSDLIIHLNASDERGIDTIRHQLFNFVNTKNLFSIGCKFVILDEVDYMTKKAQQSLIKLINRYPKIKFCLICNYITKIEESLRDSFMNFRFNQLPKIDIIHFLQNIVNKENINIKNEQLNTIQIFFESDMRSMINYMQVNSNNIQTLINNQDFDNLLYSNKSLFIFKKTLYDISIKCNTDRKVILKKFCKYFYNNHDTKIINIMNDVYHSNIQIDILCGIIYTFINNII